MERTKGQKQVAGDVLSFYRNVDLTLNAATSLLRSGFDRNEFCLLAGEPIAAAELGVSRFGCAPEVPIVPKQGVANAAFGPLIIVEPDQAPPGEALVVSQGALCSRMQAHALIIGGSADLSTVLSYCLAEEDLDWAVSKLGNSGLLLGLHAPSDSSQARAIDLLWSTGAEEVRPITSQAPRI